VKAKYRKKFKRSLDELEDGDRRVKKHKGEENTKEKKQKKKKKEKRRKSKNEKRETESPFY
jgi:hypothetical protein